MTVRSISLAVALCLASAGAAHATLWTATPATLHAVMAHVVGGDTVKLVGSFGLTSLTDTGFTSLVTINASAATFTDTLLLDGVANVDIVGGRFGSASAVTTYDKAVLVTGGSNVTFTRPSVTGYYTGQGIAFAGTTDAVVTGATLSKLHAGVVFAGVVGGSISGSRSIGSVSDGFDIVDSSDIDIGGNTCSGSTPLVGAHPDCVQLFSSAGAPAMANIAIHDNRATGMSQGFDNFGATPGSTNISIVDNRVDGLFPDGIDCYYCVDSTITGNRLTSLAGAPYLVNLNVPYGTNNIVSGNTIGLWNAAAAAPIVGYTLAELIGGSAPVVPNATGAVPEPGTWAMLVAGFGLVGLGRRRYILPA